MKKTISLFFALLFAAFSGAQTVTDINLPGLKTKFNSLQGLTRIIFLGDPTCPACIQTVADLKTNIFNQCNNPDLRGLIVWIHVQGWSSVKSDAVNASAGWSDSRVTFYWDSLWDISYGFGYQGGWAGCNWAWDIAMIYPDTSTWPGTYPRAPFYCGSKTGCCNGYNITTLKNQLNAIGECTASGITEPVLKDDFSIWPNPATGQISLELPKDKGKSSVIELFNMLGESVMKPTDPSKIDVSKLPKGVYSVVVDQGEKKYTARFVKD